MPRFPGVAAPMHLHPPAITDRKIRFALAGCGRIAGNHIESVARHAERAEIVAVCDPSPSALAEATAGTGAPGFNQYDQLLAQASALAIDCVVLATPSGLHARQAACEKNRYVLFGIRSGICTSLIPISMSHVWIFSTTGISSAVYSSSPKQRTVLC